MLKSESGASNELKVTGSSNLGTDVGGINYNWTSGNAGMTQRAAGVNAAFTVDGISMTRTTNEVDDLFDGFTLDLKKTSSSAVRISSEVDLNSVKSLIEGYVMTYNEVNMSIGMMTANDEIGEDDGALIGDSTVREIQQQLREMASTAIVGYENGPFYLSNLGVKTNRDGSLSFDQKKMEQQFKYKPEAIYAFFTNNMSTSNTNIAWNAISYTDTKPGNYAFATDGSSTHTIGGVTAAKSSNTYTVSSGDPKGISVNVSGGVTSGTIYYGKSFLNLLEEKLENYLKFNSLLDQRVANLKDQISTVGDKRRALEGRIEKLTERYQRQYAAMESSVAAFQETGNMLTAMLDNNKD
tara:strand:- start:410 stop:1468 length:1059 start_codon:yes stop_codon:yes gene_type:complete